MSLLPYSIYRLLLVGVIVAYSNPVWPQENGCWEYVKGTKNSIKKSRAKLIFDVSDFNLNSGKFIKGELELTDSGSPLTLQLIFKFSDKGYSVESGDILTIDFKDGSRNEVIYSGKRSGSGKIMFTLIKAKNEDQKIMNYEDRIFYEKLRDINISSFRLNVDNSYRVIEVSLFKSDLIRKTITCLIEGVLVTSR